MVQAAVTALAWEATRQFIKLIFQPQATSDQDERACLSRGGILGGYDNNGYLICLPKPKLPTNTPSIQPIPKISQPPTIIYQDNTTNITISINNTGQTYPDLPERRLPNPDLPTGGGRSDSVLKKIITVNTAIKKANYGHLLHEPITSSPVAFQVCKTSDYGKALEERQVQAAEKFLEGMLAAANFTGTNDSNSSSPQPNYSMSETSVALITDKNYSAGALFGIEGINDFISSFLSRSVIPDIPITGTIPLNYEYIDCEHNETQVNDLLKNLEVINIQQYIESLGLNNVSNQLSCLSAKTHTSDDSGLEYLYNRLISVSAKANTVEEPLETLKLEYLHNQVISLSIKTSANNSPEIDELKYLQNQSISLSVKNSSTDLSKLLEIVGIDDFPISVPESILSKIDSNKQQNQIATKQITSLTQFVHWFFERFDEVAGQWEIPIEIKDTDPTTPGNQSKMLKVPNMAEAMATIIELLLQISINSELDINMNTRMLLEVGQDKKQNFISYKILDAIADYLGFAFKEKEVKLPMMFTPEKEDFSEMLQESEIPVAVMELNEKYNFQADLVALKEAARIIKAAHFTKLDPKADIKQQIMDRLKSFRDLGEGISSKEDSDDFDEFLEAWQLGYTNTTGVGDVAKPYGRDFEDRPRYRRIKKVDSTDPG